MRIGRGQRRRQFIKVNQQIRFSVELVLFALLLPVFFMALTMLPPFSGLLFGEDPESLQVLFWRILRFSFVNWWVPVLAAVLLGYVSVLFSFRVFGPLHRFEMALLQKKSNPKELVRCVLRKRDYFHHFSWLLEGVLNDLGPTEDGGQGQETEQAEVEDQPVSGPA